MYSNKENVNILTDLLLSSDIKGYVANPMQYFEKDDRATRMKLDLLMKLILLQWFMLQWIYVCNGWLCVILLRQKNKS